jgi:DNA mismatch repair ATPase MutS
VQDHNCYVAIAEEFPNDASEKIKSGGLMHDRRVARVITPGTLIDENFMNPYVNNYVLSIHVNGDGQSATEAARGDSGRHVDIEVPANPAMPLGLAWLDLSTGAFFTQPSDLLSLPSTLARLSPREVVLDSVFQDNRRHLLFSILAEEKYLVSYAQRSAIHGLQDWTPMLESDIPPHTAEALSVDEVGAGNLLLDYVKDRLQGLSMKLQPPSRYESRQVMEVDKNSMRSLEIKQTIRDSTFRGSLLHAIRRTVTKSGARLLNEWISSPSTSLETINSRHDLVDRFIADVALRDGIILLLLRSHDSQRLVQKFALNRGDPDDLLRLASTIKATKDLVDLISTRLTSSANPNNDCLASMVSRINLSQPLALAARITSAIDEEGLSVKHQIEDSEEGAMISLAQEIISSEGTLPTDDIVPKTAAAKKRSTAKPTSLREHYGEDSEIWIMTPTASPALTTLHSELSSLLASRTSLTSTLRDRLSAPSLTLRWTPGLGHICHVKGKDIRATSTAKTLSSSRTTRSFHQPEWTSLGEKLDKCRFRIRAEEQRVFAALREEVVQCLVKLRRNAVVLDELDITTSFARLAAEQDLVRPVMTDYPSPSATPATTIIGGRHPTVQGGLTAQGRTFTSNDLLIGGPGRGRAWLITGPNMGGKSTFLRQNALVAILAQAGCFVPASYGEMGVVDALFSRVGSADNLFADQSTFMVEMLETASILRRATSRSFVIMDEIGRGTTPDAGTAVAFASLVHLVEVNRCRALFATHFHELAGLLRRRGLLAMDGAESEKDKEEACHPVEAYCTDVEEDGRGGFVYVHRLRKGVNEESHALKVASLAGMPELAIQMAREVLTEGTTK